MGVDGMVYFIFQLVEEGQVGVCWMIEDGLFECFLCDSVYVLYNWLDLLLGYVQMWFGLIMVVVDWFDIIVCGCGGYVVQFYYMLDVIFVVSQLVVQLYIIVLWWIDLNELVVLFVMCIEGGYSYNVLLVEVCIIGIVCSFDVVLQDCIEVVLCDMVNGIVLGSGMQVEVDYCCYYLVIINMLVEVLFVLDVV